MPSVLSGVSATRVGHPRHCRQAVVKDSSPWQTLASRRSPHRTKLFRGLITYWQDDPVTDAALALLSEWVRWNNEQVSVPAP